MGITRQQRATWPMRGNMFLPGAPSLPRQHKVWFWETIARGATTEEAVTATGVSVSVGTRWFREAGGMCPISLAPTPAVTSRLPSARRSRSRPYNEKLHAYVEDRLSGLVTRPDGTEVHGPTVRFKGRRHGRSPGPPVGKGMEP